jgi:chemotaxis regulatin CheY-phosphate phosphatase CheZ
MTARHATELLYDSEAALRLVDSAIQDLRTLPRPSGGAAAPNANGSVRDLLASPGAVDLVGLSQILARSYGEIVKVLGSLRESRSVLEQTAFEKLHHTHDKLREVTTVTQTAATDILDGLDRAVALVNDMDARANDGDTAAERALRGKLRDELFSLMGCMQFQDITTQQLTYASSVLTELETRLAQLATILDPTALQATGVAMAVPGPSGAPTFDPAASMQDAEARQAVADQIFDRSRA